MMHGNAAVGGMIYGVGQPVFVECKDDKKRLVAVFRRMLRFGALVSIPFMLGLAFIGNEFILITIGEKWLPSVPFLQLLCVYGSVAYIQGLYVFILMTFGKSNIYLTVNVIICVLQLFCVVALFPFGIMPMVCAYVLSYLVGLAIWHHCANKFIGIRWWHVAKDIFPYIAVTAVCFLGAWLITLGLQNLYSRLAVKILVSASLYLMIMKYSRSTIFQESLTYLISRVRSLL
jgi:O-antigen/teichoic acid export membrane protein